MTDKPTDPALDRGAGTLVRHARKVLGEEGVRLTANDEARVIALSLAPRFSDRKLEEIIGIIKQGWDKP